MLRLFEEVDISWWNDADQTSAHLSVVSDRNPAESMTSFCLKYVSYPLVRTHHHRIRNETLFVPLTGGWSKAEGKGGRKVEWCSIRHFYLESPQYISLNTKWGVDFSFTRTLLQLQGKGQKKNRYYEWEKKTGTNIKRQESKTETEMWRDSPWPCGLH